MIIFRYPYIGKFIERMLFRCFEMKINDKLKRILKSAKKFGKILQVLQRFEIKFRKIGRNSYRFWISRRNFSFSFRDKENRLKGNRFHHEHQYRFNWSLPTPGEWSNVSRLETSIFACARPHLTLIKADSTAIGPLVCIASNVSSLTLMNVVIEWTATDANDTRLRDIDRVSRLRISFHPPPYSHEFFFSHH